MPGPAALELAIAAYEAFWRTALPLMRRSGRLREGWDQRTLAAAPPPAELWLQAASVGEAYLAAELVDRLFEDFRPRTLLTAGTSQGLQILDAARRRLAARHGDAARVACRHLPFDRPGLMGRALERAAPRLLVLLEAELWPGLLYACRRRGVRTLVVNGRLTGRSLRRYGLWPGLWRALAPEAILAVSPADAARFARLFGPEIVGLMPNLKFERLAKAADAPGTGLPGDLTAPETPLIVFGSVRREEERAVKRMLVAIRAAAPEAAVALFPRHLHRVDAWEASLKGMGFPCRRRSRLEAPAGPGSVLLWDTVGELAQVYGRARAAFVGGSLAPTGGQNFLEALAAGLRPVIGPFWDNFAWVGREIVDGGLVRVAEDGRAAAALLLAELRHGPPREEVRRRFADYVAVRRGGGRLACERIRAMLEAPRC